MDTRLRGYLQKNIMGWEGKFHYFHALYRARGRRSDGADGGETVILFAGPFPKPPA
jgi:hypothetical protein